LYQCAAGVSRGEIEEGNQAVFRFGAECHRCSCKAATILAGKGR
jgi:hypothetical protein